jgi:hypothetical protein
VLPTGTLLTARAAHTATPLPTGQVLIAGGCTRHSCELEARGATTELFDPTSGRFAPGPAMPAPRVGHSATLLPNGKVLIAGGWDDRGLTRTAYLYDSRSRSFARTDSLRAARGGFTATPLPDGDVLFAGGSSEGRAIASAEIYDWQTETFSPSGSLRQARAAHVAVALPGGRVLVAGGSADGGVLASAEIFEAGTAKFQQTGRLRLPRHKLGASLLPGGRVLVVGGSSARDWRGRYASAELYDARPGRFRRIASMAHPRFKLSDAVARLPSGQVLVAGGAEKVELYDPHSARFRTVGELDRARSFATATVLRDGGVLIVGGYDDGIRLTARAWRYRP